MIFRVGAFGSGADVELIDLRLASGAAIANLATVAADDALTDDPHPDDTSDRRTVVSIVESDSVAAAALVHRATSDERYPVIVLGESDLPTALDVASEHRDRPNSPRPASRSRRVG